MHGVQALLDWMANHYLHEALATRGAPKAKAEATCMLCIAACIPCQLLLMHAAGTQKELVPQHYAKLQ